MDVHNRQSPRQTRPRLSSYCERVKITVMNHYTLFRTYLESHRDELLVDDLELASFVCVTSIEALTHNAVLHYSKIFSDEAMEALTDEMARLVISYLKG